MRSASIFGGMVRGAFIAGRLHAGMTAGTALRRATAFTCAHECDRPRARIQYHAVREECMNKRWMAVVLIALAGPCLAQDAERGGKLFADTRGATGKAVGNCIACHANSDALRAMIINRGGDPTDARFVRGVLQKAIEGAVPGAANAKAQYRGVLTARDLDDIAAYIAKARAS
jgi:mono/diheme cytochrome c family protein